MNKKISIVIPTINREKEVDKLLNSILVQEYYNLEVIVVDQNKKIDLREIINKYKQLKIKHLKVNFIGAAKARNYGAKFASGEIINFPDDDSEFEKSTLKFINQFFNSNNVDAVFGKVKDLKGKRDILHFKNYDCNVRKSNIYQTTIETSMFIKLDTFEKIGMYDETFGIGTYFGAEEGADLVMRLLYKNYNLKYVTRTLFFHPNKRNEEFVDRVYSYGLGFGGIVYKHAALMGKKYPVIYFFIIKIIKNLIFMIVGAITFNKVKIKYNYYSLKGKLDGIVERKKYENTKKAD